MCFKRYYSNKDLSVFAYNMAAKMVRTYMKQNYVTVTLYIAAA